MGFQTHAIAFSCLPSIHMHINRFSSNPKYGTGNTEKHTEKLVDKQIDVQTDKKTETKIYNLDTDR